TATRLAQAADQTPATASLITDVDIENTLAQDAKDLVRFEPGVSVRRAPKRFGAALGTTGREGNAGFNIRGLEGNRVLIEVDGVRVPDAFVFGPQSVGRGDYVDLDILKSVEILRGPGSALYGSDGLAGMVSFTTKDPRDMLGPGDGDGVLRTRVGYASANNEWSEGIAGAARWGALEGLLSYTRRDGHEFETQGDNGAPDSTRTEANPEDDASNSVLGKLVWRPSAAQRWRLTGEHFDSDSTVDVLSGRAPAPLGASSVIGLDAHDETKRDRAALDYLFEGDGFFDRAFASLYWQRSQTTQFTAEDRFTSPDRTRDSRFDNEVWGVTGQADKRFAIGAARHTISVGGEYSLTRQEGLRTGTVPSAGDAFPSRPFPNTDYTLTGIYVQDEIAVADGAIKFYPAVRYDYYDLKPELDSVTYLGLPPTPTSDSHVSPKFGVVLWPFEHVGAFVNLAEGFKAPAPSQINNGFTNAVQGYKTISNPDLGPETSVSLEGGLRARDVEAAGAIWRASASVFVASYDGFIDQPQIGGTFGNPLDPAVFQYQNVQSVEIRGAEGAVEGHWRSGFGARTAISFAQGEGEQGGVETPLISIDPVKLVAGLSYDAPSGRYGGQVIATHVAKKDAARAGCASCFLPPAFTILDATAYWNITDRAALRVGVFNITDEKYWWWSDVRDLTAASPVKDAFTQPGRNAGVSVSYKF
ncbi:MAG TPA: TonB-dependent hemoglobin/transferrin/lactoferrin family receptor, partial [Caulobacterales bacterium]|nr:TonB-dependent hemoglobin/transferrin/lactoferrin family receptor [Caulobacterales bacterium]